MPRHDPGLGASDAALGPDPNGYPDALTPEQAADAAVTCQFLGKTFHKDDTICYQQSVWQCTAGGWFNTQNAC